MNLTDLPLKELIRLIDDPRKEALLRIYRDHNMLFSMAPGASHNHQAWPGGYVDHIAECLRINEMTYDALAELRPLPFTKGSAAVCLFFHDMEKPFKYAPPNDSQAAKWKPNAPSVAPGYWERVKIHIIEDMEVTYGFRLTDDECNALKYTHGEGDDYRKDKRVSCPLAAHVGNCDRTSARLWPEDGKGLG